MEIVRWAERKESPRRLLCVDCLPRETRAASRLGPDRILPANSHSTTWPDGTVEIRHQINAPLPYHSPRLSIGVFPIWYLLAVLRTMLWIRIRIHRIHMFLGLPDPDLTVRGMDPAPDPDPSINMQK